MIPRQLSRRRKANRPLLVAFQCGRDLPAAGVADAARGSFGRDSCVRTGLIEWAQGIPFVDVHHSGADPHQTVGRNGMTYRYRATGSRVPFAPCPCFTARFIRIHVAANNYPTDSSLLGDGVRVLTRVMKKITEITN